MKTLAIALTLITCLFAGTAGAQTWSPWMTVAELNAAALEDGFLIIATQDTDTASNCTGELAGKYVLTRASYVAESYSSGSFENALKTLMAGFLAGKQVKLYVDGCDNRWNQNRVLGITICVDGTSCGQS